MSKLDDAIGNLVDFVFSEAWHAGNMDISITGGDLENYTDEIERLSIKIKEAN